MKTIVEIYEYDRWSGPKIDDTKEFDTLELANEFCTEFNKKNNLPIVPDWYMVAKIKNN